jgi:4-aminobutyrate aminotransferase
MTLTASKAKYHKGFAPLVPGVLHAPYAYNQVDPDTGARSHDPEETFSYLEDVLFRYQVAPSEVAAVFVEPVQGEGGYIVPPAAWLQRLRELCDKHGILLVADEVQSGMGRTGRMWAIEHAGVHPDILISAKGIASGLPLGAFMARAPLMEKWGAGAHGSTYGGSPLPCAAGLATLSVIESEGLLANATAVGAQLLDGLRSIWDDHPEAVTDVRGVGLMIGIELRTAELAERVQQRAFERGLLVLECGESSIRVSPPLVFTPDQAATTVKILGEVFGSLGS